ncbi:uncharacterized protein LOC124940438 [Impatiens glandulifera]|uniref:uncharacterized protein LOC124940438 n=1 Tax=Impatiens glandulifera TaxID=253017 RepID=UPI001FB0EE30|nr:uncharacterized protein LOC124940438 [Impatiens glandulifera]
MKNKLLICFRPVAAEEENSDDPSAVDRYRSLIPLRKSKSFTITDFPDSNSLAKKKKKKETNRSISGSFEAAMFALSFSQRKDSNGKVDLRRNRLTSKSSRFSSENRCWNPRIKESPSEASLKLGSCLLDHEEEKQSIIKNSDDEEKKKKNRVVVVSDSSLRSKWGVYLIVVMSVFMIVFYGRVYSLVVTSCLSFCFLCRRKNLKILPAENQRFVMMKKDTLKSANPPKGIGFH